MFSLIFENPSRNIAILYFLSFEKSDSNIRKNKLLFFFTDVVHSISFGQNLRLQDVQMLPIYILVFWIFIMHTHTHTNHFPCSLFFFFFGAALFFFCYPLPKANHSNPMRIILWILVALYNVSGLVHWCWT